MAKTDIRDGHGGRRFEAQEDRRDRLWTEITKDLVSEEAIKEKGYEFEETETAYFVMEHLRYVCPPPPLFLRLFFPASFKKLTGFRTIG